MTEFFHSNIEERLSAIKAPEASAEVKAVQARLEALRLDARIARALPGVGREIAALHGGRDPLPNAWVGFAERLSVASASAMDSLFLIDEALAAGTVPVPAIHQGVMRPDRVVETLNRRKEKECSALGHWLRHLEEELDPDSQASKSRKPGQRAFSVDTTQDDERPDDLRVELRFDGVPVDPPGEVKQLIDSILQDLGELPEEYLVPAGHGGYRPGAPVVADGGDGPHGECLYDEWDHLRRGYRKNWCRMTEIPVQPGPPEFVADTLRKYRGLLRQLHRAFEALREDERRLRRQPEGDDLDLDAVVESFTDAACGFEVSDGLFTRLRKRDRDIAVMFMVDMSGSTEGWINQMERESLVLLCEALEILGDRYAIYGFSGFTHRRCELYPVKQFSEDYNEEVRGRIGGITARDYTRMGAAVRHLTRLLNGIEARTRLLVVLSDGRPDDQDGYRGAYGIEDTRMALLEARSAGVHPYCVTIDTEALDYLPHLFGPSGFSIVDRIDRLPARVSEIYRRLTL